MRHRGQGKHKDLTDGAGHGYAGPDEIRGQPFKGEVTEVSRVRRLRSAALVDFSSSEKRVQK